MLLRVEELRTWIETPAGPLRAVDGASLEVAAGQTVALVGESGCGKSLTALSIVRLLPPGGRIVGGRVWLGGCDLVGLPPAALRRVRGNRIGLVFQEPMTSLNPLIPIGAQVGEALRVHRRLPARAVRAEVVGLLRRVGIAAPGQRCRDYPHQMSGGMRQRVMLAMALACGPELLIADEPTTALDVTVQAQILALLADLQQQSGLGLLFITHDLGVVAQIADGVAIMYAGRIVERGPTAAIFQDARHPYTRGLLRCTPRLRPAAGPSAAAASQRLPVIPGEVPDPLRRPPGCPFHPRCEVGRDDPGCRTQDPPLVEVARDHACACWHAPGYPARPRC